jgi:hypothetical protein
MAGSDEDHGKIRRPGVEDRGWSSTGRILGGQMIETSVMLCEVCTVHNETRNTSFLVWPQNQGRRFLPVWPQNWCLQVFWFGPQNRQLRFDDLGLKITMIVYWFGPQNQSGYNLLVASQNRWEVLTTRDTHRDLVTCFGCKQVGLGFPSLASRLVEARHGWCTWHHRRGYVEMKLKTDESMRCAASDPSTPTLSFSLY